MLSYQHGKVEKIIAAKAGYTEILVRTEERLSKAVNYDDLTGSVAIGDLVAINTTAVELGLGTGGYDFVIYNLNTEVKKLSGPGHIMKLRYTPLQFKVLSVEEEESPYHKIIMEKDSLNGAVVISGILHSMLAPIAFALNTSLGKPLRVIYVMTDGASLPIKLSKSVSELTTKGFIQGSVTVGNAFGGDLEAVNIYSGLLAAKWVLEADCIIVCMGPGIVGTGTKWGFSGIEQGQVINAVTSLGGTSIAVPRISFADPRSRHNGISHHTLTILKNVALASTIVPVGLLDQLKMNIIFDQWQQNRISQHQLAVMDVTKELEALAKSDLKINTMNRALEEEKDFFSCCLAAGLKAREIINEASVANILEH